MAVRHLIIDDFPLSTDREVGMRSIVIGFHIAVNHIAFPKYSFHVCPDIWLVYRGWNRRKIDWEVAFGHADGISEFHSAIGDWAVMIQMSESMKNVGAHASLEINNAGDGGL